MKPLLLFLALAMTPCARADSGGRFHGPEEDPLFMPSQVAALPDGRFAILDGAQDRLAFFERDGTFEAYAGRSGSGPGEFYRPLGLCTGQGDTLIVADTGNGRIQILDHRGGFLTMASTEDFSPQSKPTGVACDPRAGKIYVTDREDHSVHVFQLPGLMPFASFPLNQRSSP